VRTFTVGFDYQHDELREAAATAQLLGCQHTEIACRAADVELLPRIVYHLDEPLGDPIVIPMYRLARRAKEDVTVILTGEGADETLGGYLFHRALLAAGQLGRVVPRRLRESVLKGLVALTPSALINLAFDYPADLGERGKLKVVDFLDLLDPADLPQAYRHLISLFDGRDTAALYTDDFRQALASAPPLGDGVLPQPPGAPLLNRILALQFADWLPEDILMKQDKMSMASAIEARVPFLDHELVEYVLRVPPGLKIHHGVSKYLLRRYAQRLLPTATTRRRKMPFYVPVENYLREPAFQVMLGDTLSERAVRARGIVRPEAVARLRARMRQGEFVVVKQVFSLMVLELWFRMAVDRRGIP
jgi:asparagine synthase (glutamine-hydrolysing)